MKSGTAIGAARTSAGAAGTGTGTAARSSRSCFKTSLVTMATISAVLVETVGGPPPIRDDTLIGSARSSADRTTASNGWCRHGWSSLGSTFPDGCAAL